MIALHALLIQMKELRAIDALRPEQEEDDEEEPSHRHLPRPITHLVWAGFYV